MTTSLIPSSQELVRATRSAWGLDKRAFGARIGVTGEFAGRVEHGHQVFGVENIARGCTHTDMTVRRFWLDYYALRQGELQAAIIENCFAAQPQAV